jgi:hypothetical protein
MMKVWDDIGKTKTDTAFWEGLGMTNSVTNQNQAANAVYQAAIDLGYSNSDLTTMNTLMSSCGYTMPSNPIPDFDVVDQTGDLTVCRPNSAVYTIAVTSVFGFNEVVTLDVSGEPAGTTTDFSPNAMAAPFTSTLTIGNMGAAALGEYELSVSGTSVSGTHTTTIGLTVEDVPAAINLTAPADGAVDQSTTPTLQWQSDPMADTYSLDIATDSGFSNIVLTQAGIAGTSYNVTTPLDNDTIYYWRVQGTGPCGAGAYSSIYSFTTLDELYVYLPVVVRNN